MKKSIIQFAVLLVTLVLTQTIFADIKIKTRQTMSGQTSENTTYIKGKRQRVEMRDGQMISITQCDLRRDVQLIPASKAYMLNSFGEVVTQEKQSVTQTKTTTKTENGGTITMTTVVKDTGERKQMFGYTARHLIITTETEPSADACEKNKIKMQTDGWYIDAEWAFQCDRGANYTPYQNQKSGGCQDKYNIKQTGAAKRGYPLYEKMTMFDPASGKETYSFINEVIELSKATLDNALFEIPSDYREVKDAKDLYASSTSSQDGDNNQSLSTTSGNSGGYKQGKQSSNNSGLSESLKNASSEPPPQNQPQTESGAKKEGVVRIALATVKIGSVGEGVSAAELAAAVQNTLAQYLKNSQVEIVRLEAKLPSAIEAEAEEKECDYVVYTNVSHKKGGGGFGAFGKALGSVVSQTGGGSWGNSAANTVAAVAANTIIAASVSQNVKSKDEITLEVKMKALDASGANALTKQVKAKAKSDGEDIISQLIEQVAQAIIDAAVQR